MCPTASASASEWTNPHCSKLLAENFSHFFVKKSDRSQTSFGKKNHRTEISADFSKLRFDRKVRFNRTIAKFRVSVFRMKKWVSIFCYRETNEERWLKEFCFSFRIGSWLLIGGQFGNFNVWDISATFQRVWQLLRTKEIISLAWPNPLKRSEMNLNLVCNTLGQASWTSCWA